jgi:cation diffusion facilitator CzcD-associated flavoprotein CzcO
VSSSTYDENLANRSSYSKGPEILEYFRNLALKYNLHRFVKLSRRVIAAEWDQTAGLWKITIEDLSTGQTFEDNAHFMITASGVLKCVYWFHVDLFPY